MKTLRFTLLPLVLIGLLLSGTGAAAEPYTFTLRRGESKEYTYNAEDLGYIRIEMKVRTAGVRATRPNGVTAEILGPGRSGITRKGLYTLDVPETRQVAYAITPPVLGMGTKWKVKIRNNSNVEVTGTVQLERGTLRIVDVAAGRFHSLALASDGTIWGWGDNQFGQVGDRESFSTATTPVQIQGLDSVSAISCGKDFSVALRDGFIWAWGAIWAWDSSGGWSSDSPQRLPNVSGVTVMTAGARCCLALGGNEVWGWGRNDGNILRPTDSRDFLYSPEVIQKFPHPVSRISAGEYHALALLDNHTVFTWGFPWGSPLHGHDPWQVSFLPEAAAPSYPKDVAAEQHCSFALLESGAVMAWGWNEYGSCGVGSEERYISTPTQVQLSDPVRSIKTGPLNPGAVAVGVDGRAWGWGWVYSLGERMDEYQHSTNTPIEIGHMRSLTKAGLGENHSLFILSNGTVWACGNGALGQLGDGTRGYGVVRVF